MAEPLSAVAWSRGAGLGGGGAITTPNYKTVPGGAEGGDDVTVQERRDRSGNRNLREKAVHADGGDGAAAAHDLRAGLEGGLGAHRLDRDVHALVVCEGHDLGHGVLLLGVDDDSATGVGCP